MIMFDVGLEALPDAREGLVDLLQRTMEATLAENGCLIYRFTRDLNDPDRFHLVELWREEADLFAHARGAAFLGFIDALPKLGKILSSTARRGDLEPYTFKRPR